MKQLGVIANTEKDEAPAILARLSKKAAELGFTILAEEDASALIPGSTCLPIEHITEQADALIVFGGDGTMIRAARELGGKDIPVLGVNLGSLGFMTSVPQDELEESLQVLHDESYRISKRTVMCCKPPSGIAHRALNDVVVGWCASSRLVSLGLRVNNEHVAQYRCDGLIISTPTGSTGHSLSAGGPILHPETPAFVVSVICPHALSHRPLVLPDQVDLEVTVIDAPDRLILSVDGQEQNTLRTGDQLKISRCQRGVRFIHPPSYGYYDVLRQKLGWKGSNF